MMTGDSDMGPNATKILISQRGNSGVATRPSRDGQPHLPFGVVQDSGTDRIVVKRWSELISDAEHRLKFVQNSLEYETSHDSGLAHLREKYAQFLPDEAATDVGYLHQRHKDVSRVFAVRIVLVRYFIDYMDGRSGGNDHSTAHF